MSKLTKVEKKKEEILKLLQDDKSREGLAILLRASFRKYIYTIFLFCFNAEFSFHSFHNDIIQSLQDIADCKSEKPNLMLNLPPGAGKSVLTELFITWCFARNRDINFCYTSHKLQHITRLSSETRDIIASDIYFRLFGIKLCVDEKAKVNYSIEGASARSGLTAGTTGSAITGTDAGNPNTDGFCGGLIIDDPMDAGDARSEVVKETCIYDYINKLKTRKRSPDAVIIVIAQLLDVDDLCHYIAKYEADDFKIIKIKALNDDDTSYFPERITAKELIKMRNNEITAPTFYAQFQQQPLESANQVIKVEWFQSYSLAELNSLKFNRLFVVADTAMKTKEANDYSVFTVWGTIKRDNEVKLYLLDGIRGKWESPDLLTQANKIYSKWRCRFNYKRLGSLYVEDKASGTGLIQQLKRQSIPVTPLDYKQKDKLTRLEDVLNYIYKGQVYLPCDLLFTNDLKNECRMFSRDMKHKHDDIVDCIAYACNIAFYGRGTTIFDIM